MRGLNINKQARLDTPLATTPEPRTWQQMSISEKGNKKVQLIKEGGIERFKSYKDSVSKDASDRLNKQFEKNAATRGMTVEQLRKDNKKANVGIEGLLGEKNTKSTLKSPCKGGASTGCNK